jgi:hydrogenase expression/formation protein HypC
MCLAIPVRVTALLPDQEAMVDLGGVRKQVSLALLDGVEVGDYVIVHVGYALARLDRVEAERTLASFALLPPPVKGEGWGGGEHAGAADTQPPPQPSPFQGEGAKAAP